MKKKGVLVSVLALGLLLALTVSPGQAQGPTSREGRDAPASLSAAGAGFALSGSERLGTTFTYQGLLKKDGSPVDGDCDFQFGLYDAASLGNPVGAPSAQTLSVADGLFAAGLDFGSGAFNGQARWLQIEVRCPTGNGTYTSLGRQALTAVPYALYADRFGGYQNVIVVAQGGGDFTSIQAALNSITDNSAANRYLVWVAPGTYTETVTMKPYVDIEGAGELLTTISYVGSASPDTGTVVGANNAELRFLAVRSTGGAACATAIYNSSASPRLTHVIAYASGGDHNFGVYNYSSSPKMADVAAYASGGAHSRAVSNLSSSPTMMDVTASASGGTTSNIGVYNSSSSPAMTHVTVWAVGENSGNYGVYNVSSSSPRMTDVTVFAVDSGTGGNYGVNNESSSSPTMIDVTISTAGGHGNVGVRSVSSSPTMIQVTVSVSGGTTNTGIVLSSSSATIQNSTISAGGSSGSCYGIYNSADGGTHVVTVNNCQVTGATATIRNDAEFTVHVGASQLAGGNIVGGGTVTCIGVYDENYTSPGYTTCP